MDPLACLLSLAVPITLIVAIWAATRANRCAQQLERLTYLLNHMQRQLDDLARAPAAAPPPTTAANTPPPPAATQQVPTAALIEAPRAATTPPTTPFTPQSTPASTPPPTPPSTPPPPPSILHKTSQKTLPMASASPPLPQETDAVSQALGKLHEHVRTLSGEQILVRALVLVGGVLLALAGIYFAKYSYEHGLLRPEIRLAIGALFGAALIGGGEFLRQRSARVAQSSVAAGVAVLFAIVLAGRHVEQLLSNPATFALLTAVTAAAIALSLRHGVFVAVLGLIGGFATPALIGPGDYGAGALFGYLIVLQIGLMVVIRLRQWWWLSILMLIGGLGWALAWMLLHRQAPDSGTLGLYLLLVGGMSLGNAGDLRQRTSDASTPPQELHPRTLLGWLGGLATLGLAALLLPIGGFTALEWSYFALLSAGALVVGRLNERRAALAVAAAVVSFILIATWQAKGVAAEQQSLLAGVLIGAGALFGLGAYACTFGSALKWLWGWMSAAMGVLLWLIAWRHFDADLSDHTWCAMCLGLAALYAAMAWPWLRRRASDVGSDMPLAALTCAACFFLAAAAPMELPKQWFAVAWAVLSLLIALADMKLNIKALRVMMSLIALLATATLLLGLPWIAPPLGSRPVLNWLLYGFGVPTLAFAAVAYTLRRRAIGDLENFFCVLASACLFALVTLQVRHGFNGEVWLTVWGPRGSLWEWATYPIAWLVLGAAMAALGQLWRSAALRTVGQLVGGAAIAFTLAGLCLLFNPLWGHFDVGSTRVFNVLLYAYGIPAAVLLAGGYHLRRRGQTSWGAVVTAAGLVVLFVLVNLQVRQWFQGTNLDLDLVTSSAERYTYSVAWVLLAGLLLITGIATGSLILRWASLIILLLTIGKTFIDTKNLKDLYRVASFLGLGIALMVVGYLYHRFVFRRDALRGDDQ